MNIRKHGARGSASIGQNFKIVSAIVVACTVSQWCFVGFPYLNFYDSCRLLCCFLFHFALSWYIDIFCSIFYLFLLNFGECHFVHLTFMYFYQVLSSFVWRSFHWYSSGILIFIEAHDSLSNRSWNILKFLSSSFLIPDLIRNLFKLIATSSRHHSDIIQTS